MDEIAIGRKEIMKALISNFKGAQLSSLINIVNEYNINEPHGFLAVRPGRICQDKQCGPIFVLKLKRLLIEMGVQYGKENEELINKKIRSYKHSPPDAFKKLRFKILQRDNFRCQYCGRNPKTDPYVELQVDHIHPQAKGGSNSEDNLTTSCRDCNIGKSDVLLRVKNA